MPVPEVRFFLPRWASEFSAGQLLIVDRGPDYSSRPRLASWITHGAMPAPEISRGFLKAPRWLAFLHRGIGYSLPVSILAVFMVSGVARSQTSPAAQLLQPQGKLEVLRAGSKDWQIATQSMPLLPGDTIRTGLGSRAALCLANASLVRVDERSMLQIKDRAVTDGVIVRLLRGAGYFFHRERPSRKQFETPLVSGAIRGTEFVLRVQNDGETRVHLFNGTVDLTNALGVLSLDGRADVLVAPSMPPKPTAVIEARHVLQWCLYYPAVIDPAELSLTSAELEMFASSLGAYRAGDLPSAIAASPSAPAELSPGARVFSAVLRLGAGQAADARDLVSTLGDGDTALVRSSARALGMLIDTVSAYPGKLPASEACESASELLAASIQAQSLGDLRQALELAMLAVERSPDFYQG
ncbi:MAG: FecR domain-containing protein, partial [Verrucomicrobia bacterium]|nr:FecR domain-containing protein [Verrucomicrobiota bacterium]